MKLELIALVDENNSTYKDMLQVQQACIKAEINVPTHVEKYLNSLEKGITVSKVIGKNNRIYQFNVKDIPAGIDIIQIIITE
jgi:hypothetical protein